MYEQDNIAYTQCCGTKLSTVSLTVSFSVSGTISYYIQY